MAAAALGSRDEANEPPTTVRSFEQRVPACRGARRTEEVIAIQEPWHDDVRQTAADKEGFSGD
jgi:hypothetical protein